MSDTDIKSSVEDHQANESTEIPSPGYGKDLESKNCLSEAGLRTASESHEDLATPDTTLSKPPSQTPQAIKNVHFEPNDEQRNNRRRFLRQTSYHANDPNVLFCPDLRDKLQSWPSPFKASRYFGGGFVSDSDRVHIASLVHQEDGTTEYEYRSSHENLEALACLTSTPSFREGMARQQVHWDTLNPLSAVKEGGSGREGGGEGTAEEEGEQAREAWLAELPRFALRAGPRETIWFDPPKTRIAIVTVGGLCPGLNDVVRSIVRKACDYGVQEKNILGIRFGFRGFSSGARHPPIPLTKAGTDGIHLEGGTVLGTSTGEADVMEIVKWLDLWSIDQLYVVGGIATQTMASQIRKECSAHNVFTAVVAVPKSIDNDFMLIDKTFGFDTAVDEAQKALMAAKTEASSAYRGVGLVKLAGKESGFIAVKASLALGLVDVCLIPEVPFRLEGEGGLLEYVEQLIEERGHAVVCIAEGVAQDLIPEEGPTPRSTSSPELKDAGVWMRGEIRKKIRDVDCKYIDPSYIIRSIPPNSNDRIYCKLLAHSAVHAAFAGYTGVMVGLVNKHYVYLPIIAGQAPRRVDPSGALWSRLRASTGQPDFV